MSNLSKDVVKDLLKREEGDYPVPFQDLYKWLGYNQKSDAVKTLEKNFHRDQDYVVEWTTKKARQGKPPTSSKLYFLTTDCAKAFSMASHTSTGAIVRQYFIEAEKELRSINQHQHSYAEALKLAADALKEQEERIEQLEKTQQQQQKIQKEATERLSQTPRSQLTPKEMSQRQAINKLVREYSVANQLDFKHVWDKIYNEFKYRYSIDIPTRKSNSNKSGLQIVEDLGYTQELYALASNLLVV